MARMTREDVLALMESSKSLKEWDKNTETVENEFGELPSFWYTEIMIMDVYGRFLDKLERAKLH